MKQQEDHKMKMTLKMKKRKMSLIELEKWVLQVAQIHGTWESIEKPPLIASHMQIGTFASNL